MMFPAGRCHPAVSWYVITIFLQMTTFALPVEDISGCKLELRRYWGDCNLACLRRQVCTKTSSSNICEQLFINLPVECVENGYCSYSSLELCKLNCMSRYRVNGTNICVESCPFGYYDHLEGVKICERCHPSCDGCVGPSNRECKSCKYVKMLDGKCVDHCPEDLVVINGTCERPERCRHAIIDGQCFEHCPTGYFLPESTSFCQQCDPVCETCTAAGPTGCQTCSNVRLGHQCLTRCPIRAPLILDNECHSVCPSKLSINNSCVSACAAGQFIFNETCVTECPITHQIIKSSLCVDTCDLLLSGHECVETCPGYTFVLADKCVSTCPKFYKGRNCIATCDGFLHGYKCVGRCPGSLRNFNGSCVPDCPPSSPFNDPLNGTCVDRCNYVLHENECLQTCPLGTFQHSTNRSCGKCHDLCVKCYGPLEDQCTECRYFRQNNICVKTCGGSSLVVHGHQCLETCPQNTFHVHGHTKCYDGCPPNSPVALGRQCVVQCPQDMFVYQKKCVHECPMSTLRVDDSFQCFEECPPANSYKYQGKCLSSCPLEAKFEIYSTNPASIYDCMSECPDGEVIGQDNQSECISKRSCTSGGDYIYDNSCVSECPKSTFSFFGTCKERSNILRRIMILGFFPGCVVLASLYAYCCLCEQNTVRKRLSRFSDV